MKRQINEKLKGKEIYRSPNIRIDRQMNKHLDRRTDRQTDRQTNKCKDS